MEHAHAKRQTSEENTIGASAKRLYHPVKPSDNSVFYPPLQRKLSELNIVQRALAKQTQTAEQPQVIQQQAAEGVQGRGHRLPYLDKVQAAFGQHDISHVEAYTGSQAKQASKAIGAEAYATGNKIAFAEANPSLHTVAHEAAHIVQQRAGVHLKGGVGEVGDKYEQQADQVADAVVQGKSAERLLGTVTTNQTNASAIQAKFKFGKSNLLVDGTKYFLNRRSATIKSYDDAVKELAGTGTPSLTEEQVKTYLDELIQVKGILGFKGKTNAEQQEQLVDYLKARHSLNKTFDVNDLQGYRSFKLFLDDINGGEYGIEIKLLEVESFTPGPLSLFDLYPRNAKGGKGEERSLGGGLSTNERIEEGSYSELITDTSVKQNRTSKVLTGVNFQTLPISIDYDYKASGFGEEPLKTKIYWEEAEDKVIGKEMLAYPLGPDHPLGSSTGSNSKAEKEATNATQALNLFTGSTGKKTNYKAGHLLNAKLGGPGDNVRNITPITSSANSEHETQVEKHVKDLVEQQHGWVWYRMEVQTADITSANKPKLDDGSDLNKYVKRIIASWGQFSLQDIGGIKSLVPLPTTNRAVAIEMPEPKSGAKTGAGITAKHNSPPTGMRDTLDTNAAKYTPGFDYISLKVETVIKSILASVKDAVKKIIKTEKDLELVMKVMLSLEKELPGIDFSVYKTDEDDEEKRKEYAEQLDAEAKEWYKVLYQSAKKILNNDDNYKGLMKDENYETILIQTAEILVEQLIEEEKAMMLKQAFFKIGEEKDKIKKEKDEMEEELEKTKKELEEETKKRKISETEHAIGQLENKLKTLNSASKLLGELIQENPKRKVRMNDCSNISQVDDINQNLLTGIGTDDNAIKSFLESATSNALEALKEKIGQEIKEINDEISENIEKNAKRSKPDYELSQ